MGRNICTEYAKTPLTFQGFPCIACWQPLLTGQSSSSCWDRKKDWWWATFQCKKDLCYLNICHWPRVLHSSMHYSHNAWSGIGEKKTEVYAACWKCGLVWVDEEDGSKNLSSCYEEHLWGQFISSWIWVLYFLAYKALFFFSSIFCGVSFIIMRFAYDLKNN